MRKAFFAPDVVVTRDFVALLLGTGDREKPQDLTAQVGGAAPICPPRPAAVSVADRELSTHPKSRRSQPTASTSSATTEKPKGAHSVDR